VGVGWRNGAATASGLSGRLAAWPHRCCGGSEKLSSFRALGARCAQVAAGAVAWTGGAAARRSCYLQAAASLLNGLANLPPQPLERGPGQMRRSGGPGGPASGLLRCAQQPATAGVCWSGGFGVELPVRGCFAALRKATRPRAEPRWRGKAGLGWFGTWNLSRNLGLELAE